MVRRPEPEPADQDERLGEAIEAFLALGEAGNPPDPELFAAGYPELGDDLLAALEGLALVRGLVGAPEGQGGPGSRLETGRRIAGYRIVRELGRGGMGVVYEAVHVGLDRPVALKVLGSQAAPDSNGRRRFLNEARTAAGLHHTHIVPVFDVGQVGALCYYAMQRIEGSGLDRVIRHLRRDRVTAAGSSSGGTTSLRSGRAKGNGNGNGKSQGPDLSGLGDVTGPWPALSENGANGSRQGPGRGGLADPIVDENDDEPPPFVPPRGSAYYRWVAEVGREAAEALGHAHHRGVIHRDVKPSNLLIDGRGLIWVADFGLARRLADPSLTQHDSLLGTPRYMSPEQARVGPIDGRSDLYSLGATLFELLTLRPPFEGRSAAELIGQIAGDEPPTPRQFDPKIPRDLETVVLKLLAKRPADRYESSAHLAEDLTRFLNYEPVHARRISLPGRLWRFARRHPGVSAVSTTAAIVILAVSAIAYARVRQERDRLVVERGKTLAAMREQFLASSEVVRHSNMPNRRVGGLGLLKKAAALGPEPAMRARLRSEAVEFLVTRDVAARPAFPTGRSIGLAFAPDGARLVTLAQSPQEGESVRVWDVARRERLAEHRLRPPTTPAASTATPTPTTPVGPADASATPRGPAGRGPGPGPIRGRGRGPSWPLMAVMGSDLAVVSVDGRGSGRSVWQLTDAGASAPKALAVGVPGHAVRGIFATPDGHRIVTVETLFPGPGAELPGPRGPSLTGRRPMQAYEVNLWDPARPETPVATLLRSDPDETSLTHPLVAMSPDSKTVVVAWAHKMTVSFRSARTGEDLGAIETSGELTALALGSDNQLATAGGGEVRLWDTVSRTALPSLTPGQTEVRLLRFSPAGSLLAVAGLFGRDVEVWDTAAHSLVSVLPTADPVEDVAFSPDGRTLAAATLGEKTAVWNVIEPDVRARIAGFDSVSRSLAFRDDGLLALGVWKGAVRFREAGRCVQTEAPTDSETIRDRERPTPMVFDSQGALITLEPDALLVWPNPPHGSTDGPRLGLASASPFFGRGGGVLARSQDGRTVALVRDGGVFLRRASSPETLVSLKLPAELAARARIGRDRDRDREFNRDRGPDRGRLGFPMLNWRAAAVAPAGDRLYLIEGSGAAQVWTIAGDQAQLVTTWPGLPVDATALALSPDGKTLAVGVRPGGLVLIETTGGTIRHRLISNPAPTDSDSEGESGDGQVTSLAFSPDGASLAVGTQQGSITVWSLDAAPAPAPLFRLPAHRGVAVLSVSFDPRGHVLASSGGDKTVDVWDLLRVREEFARLGLNW